ncbi:MAG: hypothetical protein CL678_00320 [Bdellovibrionaceae bacterium]|nr:hypothetical protein [Pseudobdellovibrionaceae bacterium]|tara:strand:+ start:279 stop:1397 length:1119 start_codon:yes stop_codon:yes gene_type:complete
MSFSLDISSSSDESNANVAAGAAAGDRSTSTSPEPTLRTENGSVTPDFPVFDPRARVDRVVDARSQSPNPVADAAADQVKTATEQMAKAQTRLDAAAGQLKDATEQMAVAATRLKKAKDEQEAFYSKDEHDCAAANKWIKRVRQGFFTNKKRIGTLSPQDAIDRFESISGSLPSPTIFQAQWDPWYRHLLRKDPIYLHEVGEKAMMFLNFYEHDLSQLKGDYESFQNLIEKRNVKSTMEELWKQLIDAMKAVSSPQNDIVNIALTSAIAIDAGLHQDWKNALPHIQTMIKNLKSYEEKGDPFNVAVKNAESAFEEHERALKTATTEHSAALRQHEEARQGLKRSREAAALSPAKDVVVAQEDSVACFMDTCI